MYVTILLIIAIIIFIYLYKKKINNNNRDLKHSNLRSYTKEQLLYREIQKAKFKDDYDDQLFMAVKQNQNEKIKTLITHVNVNCVLTKYNKRTPLHEAAYNGNTHALTLLITQGAKINIQDNNGMKPLHLTTQGPKPAAQKNMILLIAHGADVNIKNAWGKTWEDLAILRPHKSKSIDVSKILEQGLELKRKRNKLLNDYLSLINLPCNTSKLLVHKGTHVYIHDTVASVRCSALSNLN